MAISKDFIVKNGLQIEGVGSAASTSTGSGALIVNGGVGVNGDLYAKNMWSNGSEVITTATLDVFGGIVQSIIAGTDISVNTATGDVTVSDTSTLQSVTGRGATTTNAISITNATASTTSTDGALIVTGGVGIQGSVYAGNVYDNNNRVLTTVSPVGGTAISISAISTGSGTTTFTINNTGVTSLAGSTYIGVSGATGTVTVENNGVQSLTAGTETTVSASTGSNVAINVTSTLQNVTARGATTNQAISITNTSTSNTTTNGAFIVAGGVGIGENLNVKGTLNVWGPAVFGNNVTFSGSATYVLSTNTVYTDNLINLHIPPGGVGANWGFDDLKDIGHIYHYYNRTLSTDTNAALILASDSQILEFYSQGTEVGGIFTGTSYGGFKVGAVYIKDTTVASNTYSGSLQVAGGVGIGGALYVAGAIYSNNSAVITEASFSNFGVSSVGGATGTIAINTGSGSGISITGGAHSLTFTSTDTLSLVTARGNTTPSAISITNSTAATSTTTGALQVTGGVGIGGDVVVGGNITATNLTTTGAVALSTAVHGGVFTVGPTDAQLLFDITTSQDTISTLQAGTALSLRTNASGSNGLTITANTGNVIVNNLTAATSTTTGALQVAGGVGIQGSVYAGKMYSNGSEVITTATLDVFGGIVQSIVPGTGIAINTSTGDVTVTNVGVVALAAGTDTAISSTTGTVTVWNTSTLQSVTGRGAATTNAVSITNTTASTSTTTGALIVSGGVGIGGALNIGGALAFGSAEASTFTSINTNTAAQLTLDSYSAATYRTAKYVVQVVDGVKVQATELLVFHDGTSAYIIQYGIGFSVIEMGNWDASLTGGIVTLLFTPTINPTSLTVKTLRTAITA